MNPVEIVTEQGHGTGPKDWVVKAEWLGARRVVFIGSIFECCRWVRQARLEGAIA